MAKTCQGAEARARIGRTAAESPYPEAASGRSLRKRSAHLPERYLNTLAVASAAPSMTPIASAPPPSETRNAGRSGTTMSLATSPKKETTPSQKTFRVTYAPAFGLRPSRAKPAPPPMLRPSASARRGQSPRSRRLLAREPRLRLRREDAQRGPLLGWRLRSRSGQGEQREGEAALDGGEVVEREIALVELPVRRDRLDGMGDELLQARQRGLVDGSSSRDHHVSDHHQRDLARARLRPRIAVLRLVGRRLAALLCLFPGLVEEVPDEARAVVLEDEIDDWPRKPPFVGDLDAVVDMAPDDLRGDGRLQGVVPVLAAAVLAEEDRVLALADVVVVRAHPREERIGPDLSRSRLHQRAADDAVVVRAGRLDDQILQERMVEARELVELHAGHVAEHRLQQARGEEDDDRREDGARDQRADGGGGRLRLQEAPLEERERDQDADARARGPEPGAEHGSAAGRVRHAVRPPPPRDEGEHRGLHPRRDENTGQRSKCCRPHQRRLAGEQEAHQHRARRDGNGPEERLPRKRRERSGNLVV